MSKQTSPKYEVGQTVVIRRGLETVKIVDVGFKSWEDEEGTGGNVVYDLSNGEWCYESDIIRRKLVRE